MLNWLRSFATAVLPGLAVVGIAHAADCSGRQAAGYRVLALDSGRKVAVWYPAAADEKPFPYARSNNGFMGSVAFQAPPAACPRVPLVLFSHGLGGCALQTLFLTEELARHGYVVAAPDHADSATCGIDREDLRLHNLRTDQSFVHPKSWNDKSELGRLQDLRATIRRVADDAQISQIADVTRVGAIGHSLGGYTVVGMAGGWPSWKTPEVKAVLALSPYVAPFVLHGTIDKLAAPVMYQGAQFDWGITPSLEGPRGAYALSAAPKFLVKLKGGTHFEWTNLICLGQANVVACLKANRNAYLIDLYGIEFLDRYLKDKPAPVLASGGRGLEKYEFDLR
jgi:predicted dienelactone hydrolase